MHNSIKLNKPQHNKNNKHKLTLIWSYSYDPRSGNEVAHFGVGHFSIRVQGKIKIIKDKVYFIISFVTYEDQIEELFIVIVCVCIPNM